MVVIELAKSVVPQQESIGLRGDGLVVASPSAAPGIGRLSPVVLRVRVTSRRQFNRLLKEIGSKICPVVPALGKLGCADLRPMLNASMNSGRFRIVNSCERCSGYEPLQKNHL